MSDEFEAILQVFAAQTQENLAAAEEALLGLAAADDPSERLNEIFRAVHTLKGDAANLGFGALAAFAHQAEELLDQVRSGDLAVSEETVEVALACLDVLGRMSNAAAGEAGRGARTAEGPLGIAAPAAQRGAGTIRVRLEKLDRLLDLTGEIVLARSRLRHAITSGTAAAALETLDEADRLYLAMQELTTRLRMVPLGPVFRSFQRSIRDLAAAQGKRIRLVVEGEEVEVDTSVVEHLRDPLLHMVRNAVDHGIEPPEARRRSGKGEMGTVTLRAVHDGAGISIEVSDDGGGLDVDGIVERARRAGVIAAGDHPTASEAYRLIFQPGLSTAAAVTSVSGRGVGLDVVRRGIELLRGSIEVASQAGAGTRITLRLPLTLAVIDGFHVEAGGATYVVPMNAVVECRALPETAAGSESPCGVLNVGGQPLPFIRLGRIFGDAAEPAPRRAPECVVVVRNDARRVGIVVDALHGGSQTLIKPLGRLLTRRGGLSGATILGSGRVGLILDLPALVRHALETDHPEGLARDA